VDRSRRVGREVTLDEAAWYEIEPASSCELPPESFEKHEGQEELTRALDGVTSVQKRVLLLRYFGDLSFEEIAETVGCPLGTALSHCRRGLLTLRKLLTVKSS
jgi:RNA polymerase sigma-70 factor, ECF subfamily